MNSSKVPLQRKAAEGWNVKLTLIPGLITRKSSPFTCNEKNLLYSVSFIDKPPKGDNTCNEEEKRIKQ